MIWQNRSFYIGVGNLGQGTLNQQNLVSLFNAFTGTAAPVQAASGQCTPGVSYWDLGVRGDTAPNNHGSGFTLSPTFSLLDDPADYPTGSNLGVNPAITSQYCNGSRVPPTCTVADGCGGPSGYGVPPGIADATAPNPVFSLTPAATVDEGNNWINVSFGPLSLSDDSVTGGANGNYGGGSPFANYALNVNSPAIDYVPVAQTHPVTDFFGNPRPDPAVPSRFDIGAIEFQNADTTAVLLVTPSPAPFGNVVLGTTPSPTQILTLRNDGSVTATGVTIGALAAPFSRTTTCGATLAAGATCTITVTFTPTTAVTSNASLTIAASVTVNGAPVAISGTGVPTTRAASVTPSPLAFGNWATGTVSNPLPLTVTNTGNVALAGGTFTFSAATPFTRITTGTFPAGAPNCAATLALGASCTIKVAFTPTATGLVSRTLTVAYTGATVTGSPVTLSGTGVATRGTVAITPIGITLEAGTLTGTGTVTLTNTTAAGGSDVAVTNVAVTGAGLIWAWTAVAGADTCTGANLAPGAICTVGVRFTRILSVGTHIGAITFTDTATGSPQHGVLTGIAQ